MFNVIEKFAMTTIPSLNLIRFLKNNYNNEFTELSMADYPSELIGKGLIDGVFDKDYGITIYKKYKTLDDRKIAMLIDKKDINYLKIILDKSDYYNIYDLDEELYNILENMQK